MRSSPNILSFADIRSRWETARAEGLELRSRDFARELQITEAELVGSGAGQRSVRFLQWELVDEWFPPLLETRTWMWLLRNEASVLEVDAAVTGEMGKSQIRLEGEGLHLTLDRSSIAHAFYVQPLKGPPRSIQFYDTHGEAVLKVYLKDRERRGLTDAHLSGFVLASRPEALALEPRLAAKPPALPAPTGEDLGSGDLPKLLEAAVAAEADLVLKVENPGGKLICRHPPEKVVPMGEWINILDPGMNLHARLDLLPKGQLRPVGDGFQAVFYLQDGRPGLELNFESQFSFTPTT